MTTAAQICRFLDEFAPPVLAESWDNTGLLLGRTGAEIRRLMTCLTLTLPVAVEAVERGVEMIVTHHPILFRGVKKLTDTTAEGRTVLTLAEAGIVVHSPHTAFDSAEAGINQWIAERLGLQEIRPLKPSSGDPKVGTGRRGSLPAGVERGDFLQRLREVSKSCYLEYSPGGPEKVSVVGIACGSAGEFAGLAAEQGCDTFVTGEARFHAVLESQTLGLNMILMSHFASERPAIEWLADVLGRQFPGIACFPSERDQNPLQLFV